MSLAKPVIRLVHSVIHDLEQAFLHLTLPCRHSLVLTTALDATRTRAELIAENALLRQQLIILHRQVSKPRFTPTDRLWLVLLASRVRNWRETLLILKPETLVYWHRRGFRLFWWFKSRNVGGRPKAASETIALIQQMARENSLWGAERIRGELMKLGIRVAKSTIQKYLRLARPLFWPRTPSVRNWARIAPAQCPYHRFCPSIRGSIRKLHDSIDLGALTNTPFKRYPSNQTHGSTSLGSRILNNGWHPQTAGNPV